MNLLLVTRKEINVYKPMHKPERRVLRLITVSCIFANDETFASRTNSQDLNKLTLISTVYTHLQKSETVDENTGKIFPDSIMIKVVHFSELTSIALISIKSPHAEKHPEVKRTKIKFHSYTLQLL